MHNKQKPLANPAVQLSKISLSLALAFAGLSGIADAAGLGRLTVQSGLGQPLQAELEITAVGKDEAGSITAKLAPPEAFRQAGLEFNPALSNLRFSVERKADGRHFVRITSTQPINEPFVDLMVELNWPTGRFVREYTFLLDPPVLRMGNQTVSGGESRSDAVVLPPAPLAAPGGTVSNVAPPAQVQANPAPQSSGEPPPPRATASGAARPAPSEAQGGDKEGSYKVVRGDTAARIAARYKPAGVTLEQAIVAIYRANDAAFMGNVNRLKAGAVLTIPDSAAMSSVSVAEARQIVRVRSSNFAAARTRIARAAKPVRQVAKAGQSATGTVGAAVVDPAPAAVAQDKVKISPSKGAGVGSAMGSSQAAKKEASVATQAALAEAQARVQQLEQNVKGLRDLLAVKEKDLAKVEADLKAERQKKIAASGEIGKAPAVAKVDPPKVDAPRVDPPKVDAPKVEVPKLEAPKVDAPKVDAPKVDAPKSTGPSGNADPLAVFDKPGGGPAKAEAPGAAVPPVSPPVVPPVVPQAPAGDAPKAEAPKVEAPKVEPPKVDAPKAAPPKAAPPAPPVVAERSILETVQEDYPFALPGLGLLALAGGGYAVYSMRRRKKAEKFEDSIMEADNFSANSLFGTTGGQNVDTSAATASATLGSTRTETGVEVGSTEVDPIAEAEVYIAYGRESQAETILLEALKKQNDRQAIRMKLLEIYAARKDSAAFEGMARQMYDMTRGKNEEWPKVVTLGLSIDPSNPFYAGTNKPESGGSSGPGLGAVGAGLAAAGAAGAAGIAGLAGKANAAVDSLQAASQLVPPIPDFAGNAAADSATHERNLMDFDLGDSNTITKAANKLNPAQAKPMASLDLPSLDLPPKATSAVAKAEVADAGDNALDFSIDLPSLEALTEKGANAAEFTTTEPAALTTAIANLGTDTNTQSAAWQEMATKLDLASAYEEIGDKDGARELLEEVIKGGDPGQQKKARAMLAKLG